MKCYVADKPMEQIMRELAPATPGVSAVSAVSTSKVVEMPVSFPTLPYYNSMAMNMRLANDGNSPVTIADLSCAFNVIFVIGTGGTGGFLVRDLARYVSTLPYAKTTLMILMDEDELENKNLVRQNFIGKDIGKNKAEVLAQRYAQAFGIKIVHIPTHLTEKNIHEILSNDFLGEVISQHLCNGVAPTWDYGCNVQIASCVDNNKTRVLISNYLGLNRNPEMFGADNAVVEEQTKFRHLMEGNGPWVHSIAWIDSGNETSSGQVICYYDTLFASDRYAATPGGAVFGMSQSGSYNNSRVSDAAQRVWKSPGQYLEGFLSSGVSIAAINQNKTDYSTSNRNTATSTPDAIATRAAKHWMLNHKMGTFGIEKHAEFMKTIKELNPMDPKFNADVKYVLANSIRNLNDMRMNLTFPVTYMFPNIFDQAGDKLNTEMSCAERSVADPQNIMINIQAASFMMNYFSKVLATNPKNAMLNSFGVSWNNNQSKEYYMTESNIKGIFTDMLQYLKPTVAKGVAPSYKVLEYKQGNKTFTTVS